MSQSKADVILHPVRMKIIQALAERSLTVQQLMEIIKDVPQATLYRHLNMLRKHKILLVENEKQVRGAVEKTYTLDVGQGMISAKEATEISKDELLRYYMTYYANLLRLTEEYLDGEVNLETDGYGFHQLELHLSMEEWQSFHQDYRALINKYFFNPRPDRIRRTMATSFIPEKKPKNNE